jgi:hypothetical protein
MPEELAWTQQLPALAHLLGRDDVPRKEHRLPRPPTPEQDQLIQRESLRRDDLLSNALLLCATPACASANVWISSSIVCALSAPTNGRSTCPSASSNGTLGPRGFHGLSTGRTDPFSTSIYGAPYRSFAMAAAARAGLLTAQEVGSVVWPRGGRGGHPEADPVRGDHRGPRMAIR